MRAVIFDMDGLMFDTSRPYLELIEQCTLEKGMHLTKEEILWFNGISSPEVVQLETKYPGITQVMDIVNERYDDYFFQRFPNPGDANKPGLKELYQYLRMHGYKVAVASGSRACHIQNLINHCGFDFQPDVIVSSYSDIASKPAPDVFLKTAECLHLPKEECLVLEDSYSGTLAAYRANMRCVTILDVEEMTSGFQKIVDLETKDLKEVIQILENL